MWSVSLRRQQGAATVDKSIPEDNVPVQTDDEDSVMEDNPSVPPSIHPDTHTTREYTDHCSKVVSVHKHTGAETNSVSTGRFQGYPASFMP